MQAKPGWWQYYLRVLSMLRRRLLLPSSLHGTNGEGFATPRQQPSRRRVVVLCDDPNTLYQPGVLDRTVLVLVKSQGVTPPTMLVNSGMYLNLRNDRHDHFSRQYICRQRRGSAPPTKLYLRVDRRCASLTQAHAVRLRLLYSYSYSYCMCHSRWVWNVWNHVTTHISSTHAGKYCAVPVWVQYP